MGRALALLHEGMHAFMQSQGGAENAGHDNMVQESGSDKASYRGEIQAGLAQFNKDNNLGFTDKQVEDLSYYGLGGTKEFNEHFKLDPAASDYKDKYDAVISDLHKLIYTENLKK